MTGLGRRVYGDTDPRWRARVRAASLAASWVVLVGGGLGLIGRVTRLSILAQWVPRPEVRPMQPATAVLFILGAVAVITALNPGSRLRRRLGLAAAVATTLGGLAIVLANIFDVPFPLWLLNSLEIGDIIGGEAPARPALNVGVVMAVVGLSVVLLTLKSVIAHVFGQVLSLAAAMVGATVVVAFAYGDDSLRGFPLGSGRMPISAALLVIVLCLAVVAARPALGLMAPVISPWPGGIVLRRLLPVVLAGPPAAVALLLAATTPESQPRWLAVIAVVVSGILLVALFATADAVSRSAQSREVAYDLTDRATEAVGRDAAIVDMLFSRLSTIDAGVSGLDVAVRFRPAAGWLAGDAALTVRLDRRRLAAILIDVVGHGPEPALAALRLGDAVRQALQLGYGPGEALAACTWVLDEPDLMASATVIEIDATSGSTRYASAANPPLLHRGDSGVTSFDSTGPVLLPEEGQHWNEGSMTLAEGEILLAFTDGLADPTMPASIEVATIQNLSAALVRCPYAEAGRVADWCLDESVGRAGGLARDDASLIVVRRDSRSVAGEHP